MFTFDSLSLCWRVEARRFLLTSQPQGSPELHLDDGRTLAMTPEEWRALADVVFRVSLGLATPLHADVAPAQGTAGGATTGRRGKAWTDEEDARLVAAHVGGDELADIARALARTRGGVLARLVKLGRIDEQDAGLRWPLTRTPEGE